MASQSTPLLPAIPSFEAKPHPIPLNGEPRSPINPDPNVCRLYGRCLHGQDRCHQAMPTLQPTTAHQPPHAISHQVACHFPQTF